MLAPREAARGAARAAMVDRLASLDRQLLDAARAGLHAGRASERLKAQADGRPGPFPRADDRATRGASAIAAAFDAPGARARRPAVAGGGVADAGPRRRPDARHREARGRRADAGAPRRAGHAGGGRDSRRARAARIEQVRGGVLFATGVEHIDQASPDRRSRRRGSRLRRESLRAHRLRPPAGAEEGDCRRRVPADRASSPSSARIDTHASPEHGYRMRARLHVHGQPHRASTARPRTICATRVHQPATARCDARR